MRWSLDGRVHVVVGFGVESIPELVGVVVNLGRGAWDVRVAWLHQFQVS